MFFTLLNKPISVNPDSILLYSKKQLLKFVWIFVWSILLNRPFSSFDHKIDHKENNDQNVSFNR